MLKASQKLQEARLNKNLTLEEVSKATKIKAEFLMSIEKGEFHKLPSRTYAHGFVRNYIDFLGLPKKETLALFRREFNAEQDFKVLPEGLSRPSDFSVKRSHIGQSMFFIITILLIVVGYILFQYRFAFINPPLEIFTPKEGAIVPFSTITVTGKTDPNATVFVESSSASVDTEGKFTKKIDALSPKSTIRIKAVNIFGRQTFIERHVQVRQ